jgi:phytanoyl-CoA hydroxylase
MRDIGAAFIIPFIPQRGSAHHPAEARMLTRAQIDEYNEVGAIVVPDVFSPEEVAALRRVTDEFVERARAVTAHTAIYDLEDTHTPAQPRVRRIKAPHLHHPVYASIVTQSRLIEVLCDLWGPNVRFDTAKLNLKAASFGAPVEWHQDWAFYPHTNDDLAAVGVMMDDMEEANGPLLIIPGSHKGPLHDHHANGRFCGAMDPTACDVDFTKAVPLLGRAGSISVHHARTIHGSALNTSNKDRRLLLFQFRAADAWPLVKPPEDIDAYNALMVAGQPTLEPRLTAVPVRLPLPPADRAGSIYENQKGLANRFFTIPAHLRGQAAE